MVQWSSATFSLKNSNPFTTLWTTRSSDLPPEIVFLLLKYFTWEKGSSSKSTQEIKRQSTKHERPLLTYTLTPYPCPLPFICLLALGYIISQIHSFSTAGVMKLEWMNLFALKHGINRIYDQTACLDTRGSCDCSYSYLQNNHPEIISVQCSCLELHHYY